MLGFVHRGLGKLLPVSCSTYCSLPSYPSYCPWTPSIPAWAEESKLQGQGPMCGCVLEGARRLGVVGLVWSTVERQERRRSD